MTDDPVDCLRLFDKRYDSHLTSTGGAQQRIHFIDFADHLAPLLTSFCMTGGTESARLAGKHQEPLFPTVRAPDAGKPAHRIAAVEILLNNILDDGPEISVISHKPALVFSEKLLEVMKKHPIKNSEFRMTLTVNPCHDNRDDSKNGPGWTLADIHPLYKAISDSNGDGSVRFKKNHRGKNRAKIRRSSLQGLLYLCNRAKVWELFFRALFQLF